MLGRVSGAGIQAPAHHRHEGVVGQSLPISVPQFPHLSLLLCVQKGVGWWGKSQKVLLKPAPPPSPVAGLVCRLLGLWQQSPQSGWPGIRNLLAQSPGARIPSRCGQGGLPLQL